MDVLSVGLAAAIIGITGLLIGLLLGVAGKKFAVEVDEKEQRIRESLPGNNCGGCGYAGCDALAKAIAAKEAPVTACPVAGAEKAKEIAAIIGVSADAREREVAYVKCGGTCDKTEIKYHYHGIADCKKLALIPGHGSKKCSYGCMGYGTCVRACPFHAIKIIKGIAVVDRENCKGCGKCIGECPNHLIELMPYEGKYRVACNSKDKGKEVKAACKAGCIGCGICAKQCDAGAITLENNIAHIDQEKCTGCGKCMDKCPVKIICR